MEKIVQDLFFNSDDLIMTKIPSGTCFSLQECVIEGIPGAPAFPVKNISIALPPRTKPTKLTESIVKKTLVSQEPIFAACIQAPMVPYQYADYPENRFVAPDEELYKKSINGTLAVMGKTITIGDIPVVGIAVSPMRYNAEGRLEFIEHVILEITITDDKDADKFIKPLITSRQRTRERSLVHELIINPDLVEKFPIVHEQTDTDTNAEDLIAGSDDEADDSYQTKPLQTRSLIKPWDVDYLIITDNNKWNAQTMTITGSAGDMTSEFNRLAKHKESKGYRVHVAQVKDIVAGKYGNFKTNSRDLQEVIRKFIREFVFPAFGYGIEWLLLGGDVSVIPHRLACGCAHGRIWKKESIKNINESEWRGTFLGMRVDLGQCDWSRIDAPNDDTSARYPFIVSNYRTGERIPFDANGASNAQRLGWYFCTDNTFSVRVTSGKRSTFIRVNGPANRINDNMVCYVYENMIPTDLYYSSIFSPLYNRAGLHDWDLLNNGLYGQHNEDNYLQLNGFCGVDFRPDFSVGRAPVESQDEAKTFVDKVIEYDNWGATHPSADYNRFKKMLYVAKHWGYFRIIKPNNTTYLLDNQFYCNAAAGYALIRNSGAVNGYDLQIRCCRGNNFKKKLEYNINADADSPGWYFAKSKTDLSPSHFVFMLNNPPYGMVIVHDNPIPTEWIVVKGKLEDISPLYYEIDEEGVDNSVTEQEELLKWMHSNFPRINQVKRLYSDIADMTAGGVWAGAELEDLTSDKLEQALNSGPHFVSLTGHGNFDSVANLDIEMAKRLNNGNKTFIAFADSCQTNEFDQNDALGECLLLRKGGGAVAYIGNTRFSWISLGALFRMEFFKYMKYFRHIGYLNDSRYCLINTSYSPAHRIWTVYEQTLLGDPEMNVYRDDQDAIPRYVGNKKTKQLHQSTCQWVEKYMANSNKKYFDSIEEGLRCGYDGCYYCLRDYDRKPR